MAERPLCIRQGVEAVPLASRLRGERHWHRGAASDQGRGHEGGASGGVGHVRDSSEQLLKSDSHFHSGQIGP